MLYTILEVFFPLVLAPQDPGAGPGFGTASDLALSRGRPQKAGLVPWSEPGVVTRAASRRRLPEWLCHEDVDGMFAPPPMQSVP